MTAQSIGLPDAWKVGCHAAGPSFPPEEIESEASWLLVAVQREAHHHTGHRLCVEMIVLPIDAGVSARQR